MPKTPRKAAPAAASPVDWKKLKGVTGPATRMPAYIKALVAEAAADREAAYRALNESLYTAGVVSEAAASAMPLLFDVVATGREGAFLAAWLIGDTLAADHLHALTAQTDAASGSPSWKKAREQAVLHKQTLLDALSSTDGDLRSAASFALAFLLEIRALSGEALRSAIRVEADPTAQASMVLSLAVLAWGQSSAEDSAVVATARARGAEDLVGGAGALATWLLAPETPLASLAGGLLAFVECERSRERWPWGRGRNERPVAALARRLGRVSPVALALSAALMKSKAVGQATARLLFDLGGFSQQWQQMEVALPEELSSEQQAIARALALQEGLRDLGWGLPPSARDRRRWLGQGAGPLEKRIDVSIDGKRREWPIWKVWRTLYEQGLSSEDIPAVIGKTLSPDQTVEALAEVGMIGYRIPVVSNGRRPAPATIAEAVRHASPAIAAWARTMADELVTLIENGASPELGGIIGAHNEVRIAVCLSLLRAGTRIEARWTKLVPLRPPEIARPIVETLPAEQREECVWAYAKGFQEPDSELGVPLLMAFLDLAPSERIAEVLVRKLRNKQVRSVLGKAVAEAHLETVQALAEREPGVRRALEKASKK